ncbi:TIGR04282 family arsenosugar biosynthesis glycosyltransferase [Actinomadura syzygii]|uniref:TIGR04282 family arsenosugar biosynthesis glycosyltransferase n=1 Tax=Actinomadura syzygii TaxID=1427538 RepID=UPI001CA30F0D|nr:TIGR04282 family arsenosugar biosynthesis glycosyltransferase [Actinomadura syzygii]
MTPEPAAPAVPAVDPVVDLVVIAKEPAPGRVKTRLSSRYTPGEAAGLAEAALRDTLAAVTAAPAGRRTLALSGTPGPWLPDGVAVVAQRGGGLDERLAAAFDDAYAGRPLVLIGMDTPQVTPALLAEAGRGLARRDAVLGPASDGGFWLLGLRRPDARLLRGVPMSTPRTGAAQLARLHGAGLAVGLLPELTDVDVPADADAVAELAPATRFAAAVRALRAARAEREGVVSA